MLFFGEYARILVVLLLLRSSNRRVLHILSYECDCNSCYAAQSLILSKQFAHLVDFIFCCLCFVRPR